MLAESCVKFQLPPCPAPLSAVPSPIFRAGFWGSAAINSGGDRDTYTCAGAGFLRCHPSPDPSAPPMPKSTVSLGVVGAFLPVGEILGGLTTGGSPPTGATYV